MQQDGDLDLAVATIDTFTPHLGAAFHIDGEVFVLLAAEALGSPPAPGTRAPFELVFSGPAGLPQRLYRLVHAELGGVLVLLVPRGAERYSATIV